MVLFLGPSESGRLQLDPPREAKSSAHVSSHGHEVWSVLDKQHCSGITSWSHDAPYCTAQVGGLDSVIQSRKLINQCQPEWISILYP